MQTTMPKEIPQSLIAEYQSGETQQALSKKYEIKPNDVSRALQDKGVLNSTEHKINRILRRIKPKTPPPAIAPYNEPEGTPIPFSRLPLPLAIAEDYRNGISVLQISKHRGISYRSAASLVRLLTNETHLDRGSKPVVLPPEAIAAYESGATCHEISQRYKVSHNTVKAFLIREGILVGNTPNTKRILRGLNPTHPTNPAYSEKRLTVYAIAEDHRNGHPISAIAQQRNIPPYKILKILESINIPLPPPPIISIPPATRAKITQLLESHHPITPNSNVNYFSRQPIPEAIAEDYLNGHKISTIAHYRCIPYNIVATIIDLVGDTD